MQSIRHNYPQNWRRRAKDSPVRAFFLAQKNIGICLVREINTQKNIYSERKKKNSFRRTRGKLSNKGKQSGYSCEKREFHFSTISPRAIFCSKKKKRQQKSITIVRLSDNGGVSRYRRIPREFQVSTCFFSSLAWRLSAVKSRALSTWKSSRDRLQIAKRLGARRVNRVAFDRHTHRIVTRRL